MKDYEKNINAPIKCANCDKLQSDHQKLREAFDTALFELYNCSIKTVGFDEFKLDWCKSRFITLGRMRSETIKWTLVNRTLTADHEGYHLTITLGGALGLPYWAILKDGVIVDECYRHGFTKNDLTARVMVERCLRKLLDV